MAVDDGGPDCNTLAAPVADGETDNGKVAAAARTSEGEGVRVRDRAAVCDALLLPVNDIDALMVALGGTLELTDTVMPTIEKDAR